MTSTSRIRKFAAVVGALGLAAMATAYSSAAAPKFLADDPLWVERDTEDASGMKPLDVNLFVDFAYNVITGGGRFESGRAKNVNTVDEVPDSSWFTNRVGFRPLTPEDIARGPNTGSGPLAGAWVVTASKSDGVTPGFTVKDGNGQRWFLKFDPPGYRGMSTGTEVAVTKLMWALGYHVPENYIAYMRRDQLVVGPGARFTPPEGKERAMRLGDIDRLLGRADREADGSFRVIASKALPGKPIGRIRFIGTRPDDPNDLVPHEDRRELRGYGVFAAWLNHVDAKAINSLDMLMKEEGRSFVRHNLIDFGSALGSGGVGPAEDRAGSQYLVERAPVGRQMAGFGLVFPAWHKTVYYESPAIGRLTNANASFDPDAWRPRVPNRAFLFARSDDKFWAAQKLAALSTELIRAAVATGDFGDPGAEAFLVTALAERRDAIIRAYLTAVNPVAGLSMESDGSLSFRNAAVDADVARAPKGYRAVWSRFDNATGESTRLAETTGRTTRIVPPDNLPAVAGVYVRVEIGAIGASHESWEKPVHAYFRRAGSAWQLVGFERMPVAAGPALTAN